MLTHHSAKDYTEAASDAARHARARMEAKFASGARFGDTFVQHVEENVPDDYFGVNVARDEYPRMSFAVDDSHLQLSLAKKTDIQQFSAHNNAISQLVSKFDQGPGADYLINKLGNEPWRLELAAHTLNTYLRNSPSQRFLLRSLKSQVRAILSDRYKRYDSRPLTHTFIDTIQERGAYVTDGHISDLRYNLKAFMPVIFEPVPNEVMCFGVEMTNSDFGGSRYVIRLVMWRLWCTNYATVEYGLKEVHIGSRLPEDIAMSAKTMELDTALMVSSTKDVIAGLLNPAKIDGIQTLIRSANDMKMDWVGAKALLNKHLNKEELKDAELMFENESDDIIGMLPKAKSVYKVSQILGWQANQTKDTDRKMDLERAAGDVLMRAY